MNAAPELNCSPAAASPLVSVILPVYQGENLVLGAVQSALRQTHRALEVLVVDDGSTDATLERLTTVDDPRLQVVHQANAGVGAARNSALARARGQYVAFLDCDDRWFPEKVASELAVLQRSGSIAIAYSSYYAVDDTGRLQHAAPVRTHAGRAFDLLIDGEDFLMPSLCLFDRRIFEAIGAFDPFRYHEDHDFILRATRRFPIYPTGRRLAIYRQTLAGKCRSILADYERAYGAEMALLDEFGPLLSPTEAGRLRDNVIRSLYVRFLMYGFDQHARRLQADVGVGALSGSFKNRLSWIFAKTGFNLVAPARKTVQAFHRVALQDWWRRYLARHRLELRYD
ncbi:MAG: glycosyltransferase family A protein [Candidatus Baltobacteraceae bacterium]